MNQTKHRKRGKATFQHIVSVDCTSLTIPDAKPSGSKSAPVDAQNPANTDTRKTTGKIEAAKPDGEERIYRIDQKHEKFLSSHLLQEPRLHVSVKASQSENQIELDQLIRQKKAVRHSQGADVQQIVVSAYESVEGLDEYETADLDILFDPNSVVLQVNIPGLKPATPSQPKPSMHAETPPSSDSSARSKNTRKMSEEVDAVIAASEKMLEAQSSSASQPPSVQEIKPAWEVVAFRWPSTIRKLCNEHRSSFKKLLTSLQQNTSRELRRIGVVNAARGQGSTTLATCIAKIIADAGQRVLLSDLDIEHPGLEEVANIQLQAGWQEMLEKSDPISEYLVRDSSKQLTLMPLHSESNLVEKRPQLLDEMRKISDQLVSHFDYSVFDIGDAKNLMVDENCHVGFLEGVVIVSDTSSFGSTAAAIYEKLIAAGVPAVVIAENFRSQTRTAA